MDLISFLGALPDAIAQALADMVKIFGEVLIGKLADVSLRPMLHIKNPMAVNGGDNALVAAHDKMRLISVAVLPLMIAGSLLAWPFSKDRQEGLWEMALRVVAVVLFIAIAKPLFAFGIDAHNALVNAIFPESAAMSFQALSDFVASNPGNNPLTAIKSYQFSVAIIGLSALLLLVSILLSAVLLLLRWYIVYLVFVGAPLFAVLWYASWGPIKPFHRFASKFLRMGVYALLVGPVVALAMLVYGAIVNGGWIAGGGDVFDVMITVAFALIFPILLFIIIYKMISWAGQPIGAGEAFMGVLAAGAAAVGAASVAAGSLGGGAAGAGAGGAGGASSTGGTAGGASGTGAGAAGGSTGGAGSGASGASASASSTNSMVDIMPRQSIGEDAAQNVREQLDTAHSGETSEDTAGGATASPQSNTPRYKAKAHHDNAGWIQEHATTRAEGEGDGMTGFDVDEARERGLFADADLPEPASDAGQVAIDDGTIEYPRADNGEMEPASLSDLQTAQEAEQAKTARKAYLDHHGTGAPERTSKLSKDASGGGLASAALAVGPSKDGPYGGSQIGRAAQLAKDNILTERMGQGATWGAGKVQGAKSRTEDYSLSNLRQEIITADTQARAHEANAERLQNYMPESDEAYEGQKLVDVDNEREHGIFADAGLPEAAPNAGEVEINNGQIEYPRADNGEWEKVKVSDLWQSQESKAADARSNQRQAARRAYAARIPAGSRDAVAGAAKAGPKAGRTAGKAGLVAGKVGGAAMLGAAMGNPYLGYRMGGRAVGEPLIGPGKTNPDQPEGGGSEGGTRRRRDAVGAIEGQQAAKESADNATQSEDTDPSVGTGSDGG